MQNAILTRPLDTEAALVTDEAKSSFYDTCKSIRNQYRVKLHKLKAAKPLKKKHNKPTKLVQRTLRNKMNLVPNMCRANVDEYRFVPPAGKPGHAMKKKAFIKGFTL